MRPVLVTTEFRGIFFGYLHEQNGRESLTLRDCRCAIYFGGTGGFLRLASDGPCDDDRIGSKAESVVLYGITSITDVSAEAEARWQSWN